MKNFLKCLTFTALLLSFTAANAAFVSNNTNGGDGFVTGNSSNFSLFSGNNGKESTTTYLNSFATSGIMNFSWIYHTSDEASKFDPAGYVLNGFHYLIDNWNSYGSGSVSNIAINAGDTFGWFIQTEDGVYGRGRLDVTSNFTPSSVPVPAALPLMASALAMFGIARRRKTA
ncbi:MAG: VPLPA-CTERM sorting domain-containing protein [Methylophilus sp.]